MRKANDVVAKFIMPWLEQHHPHADLVIMAGSYGRSMKEGKYAPLASSDIDLVIIYSDLEKGGFKCAAQSFTQEDVGAALGEGSGIMMVDTNIHDLASLHYHDKIVREQTHMAFMNVMIDEGYILRDRLGIGQVMQEKAKKFLHEGPSATPRPQWEAETARLQGCLDDIRTSSSVEEKRFLGALMLIHVCEYTLGLNQHWRSGSNQAYRSLSAKFPNDAGAIEDAFSSLIRTGASDKAETVLGDLIARGRALTPQLPVEQPHKIFPVEKFVAAGDSAASQQLFLKFMTEHLAEALGTSGKRGELAYLENLSATLNFIKTNLELQTPRPLPTYSRIAMHFLADKAPNLMPVTLQAVDEKNYPPLRAIAEDSLKHMGGTHYTRLDNIYADDLARVNATKGAAAKSARNFKPGFTP